MCGYFDATNLAIMPNGTWLCQECYDGAGPEAYGRQIAEDEYPPLFSDMPHPAGYRLLPPGWPDDAAVERAVNDWLRSATFADEDDAQAAFNRLAPKMATALRAAVEVPADTALDGEADSAGGHDGRIA